jgi:tetratricopeptide (TPR) repeat protein
MNRWREKAAGLIVPGVLALVLGGVVWMKWRPQEAMPKTPAPVGSQGAPPTTAAELNRMVGELERRVAKRPNDAGAAARLADVLLRQARVASNPGLAVRAEEVLKTALRHEPSNYDAMRAMQAVLLSQHRFQEAIELATRGRTIDPIDSWNDGVLGDAHLELGEYAQAFDAFEQMMKHRPSGPAYARASYARELQGDLDGALRLMQMATDATSAHDPEGQAWHHAQTGDLLFQLGRLDAAQREYDHAAFIFPAHPFAAMGRARVKVAQGDYRGALDIYLELMKRGPQPFLAARAGELYEQLGEQKDAERCYALAENGWRYDTPEPTLLVAFLAAHDRKLSDAVTIGEQTAARRHDIFTMDALAWAYFRSGRVADAAKASAQAMRTNTRDRTILYHAAAIAQAAGNRTSARTLLERALNANPHFDLASAPAARELLKQVEVETNATGRAPAGRSALPLQRAGM